MRARIARAARQPSLWAAAAVGLVVVAPVLAAGLAGWRADWLPAGDWAVIELRARDTGSAHTPLVGPYSRYGWNHPGPMLFWFLAVPYRLTGSTASSLLAAAAAVNTAAIGLTLAVAWRRGRLALVALLGLALATVVLATTGELLRDPWNPWVTPFTFGLLLVASWAAGEGDRPALVVAVAAGSFLGQSHVGFGPLVAALLVWAFVGCWRAGGGRAHARVLGLAAATLAVCWAPVLVDLLRGGPNVGLLVDHFGRESTRAGWSEALRLAARHLELLGPWNGGDEPVRAIGGTVEGTDPARLVVPVLAFAGAALAARWARSAGGATGARARSALRLQGVVLLAVVVGVASVAQISDGVYDYLVRWWWLLGALWWVAVAWSLWSAAWALHERRGARTPARGGTEGRFGRYGRAASVQRASLALAALVVVVGTTWTARTVADLDHQALPTQDWQPALASLTPPLVAALDGARQPGAPPVMVHGEGPESSWVLDGVVLQLDRAGVAVVVHDGGVNEQKFGPRRLVTDAPGHELWVVTGTRARERALARDRAELVASWDALGREERAVADARLRTLVADLAAAERDDLVADLAGGNTLPPEVLPASVAWEDVEVVNGDLSLPPPVALVLVPAPAA